MQLSYSVGDFSYTDVKLVISAVFRVNEWSTVHFIY